MSSSTSSSKSAVTRITRSYLTVYALALALSAGSLAALNIVADPYDVFATLRSETAPIWGGSSTRMSKAYALRQQKPDCLILGTSRAAIGYNASHPAWNCERVYNAGLQKAHLYEVRRYLEHTIAQGRLRQVFLGLDFEMFRNTDVTLEDFGEQRLAVNSEGKQQAWPLDEVLGLAFSLDTAKLSVPTLRTPPETPWFLHNGTWDEETLVRVLEIREHGIWATSRNAANILRNLLGKTGAYTTPTEIPLPAFRELERVIKLCKENDIRLTLVVNPVHASYHELLFQIGLHDEYEIWKAAAGRVIQAHSPEQKVWDFDRPNRYSVERIPAAHDRIARMGGFWDPSHFSRVLGDHVLNQALTGADPATEELFTGAAASATWAQQDEQLTMLVKTWLEYKSPTKKSGAP